jgi:hypothetical protein
VASGGWTHGDSINLAVAVGTILLAGFAFLQIVRDARGRPDLTLNKDVDRLHTRLEGAGPWIRLIVSNSSGRRTAHGTRVLLHWFRPTQYAAEPTSLAGAELGWPSTFLPEGAGAVIFGGQRRPLDFGALGTGPIDATSVQAKMMGHEQLPDGYGWWFRFTLAMHGNGLYVGREFLPPLSGGYTARLLVGADDGPAKTFDVKFDWVGQAPTPEAALNSFTHTVTEVREG